MISKETVIGGFQRNTRIIHSQTEGLCDEDALLQMPFRGNCLNWVVAHILVSRDDILEAFGEKRFLTEEEKGKYKFGSDPITEESELIIPLSELLQKLDLQEKQLVGLLEATSDERLSGKVDFHGSSFKLAELVFFLYFHETYHTGQTEHLRQLAGKNDKVI